MKKLTEKIKRAKSIVLSTHRQCDGDGLGAEIGLFHALKKTGKNVRILNVDETPRRYQFMTSNNVEVYERPHTPLEESDLALIFDTNDRRLLGSLYGDLEKKCKEIIFVDHHPPLSHGPLPTSGSLVDIKAASTGEIAYFLIKELGIPIDENIAKPLYASIVFDTQMFRYIRSSTASHEVCIDLLKHLKNSELIHRHLFGNHTIEKMSFLAKALGQIEYFHGGQLAVLNLKIEDLRAHRLEPDESRDVIDFIMNIESLQAAALFREDAPSEFKLSLRSKGLIEVLGVAESVGGGGHVYSSGAYLKGNYGLLRDKIVTEVGSLLKQKYGSK